MVVFGKVWEINNRADYDEAMIALEEAEFIAEMADDHRVWYTEKNEVARQKAEVRRQAKEKGIL